MIEKCCKHTDNTKYKHSHQKNAKSEVKHLTRSSVPDTIFVDKRQSGISAQFARITTHPNNTHFSQNNLGFVRGAATPLSPRLFVGGKRDTCQTQVSLFPPISFSTLPKGTPLWKPHP